MNVLTLYNPWTTQIQTAKTFTVLHVVSCNPKWLQTISLSSSYTQRTSGYSTPCTSARQTNALSHSRRLVKHHVTRSTPMKRQEIGKGCCIIIPIGFLYIVRIFSWRPMRFMAYNILCDVVFRQLYHLMIDWNGPVQAINHFDSHRVSPFGENS